MHHVEDIPYNLDIIKAVHNEDNPEGFYFEGNCGRSMSENTLRSRFKKALINVDIDIEKLSTHSLRKGGAVRLAENEVGVDPIKYQGGWKSPVFLKYTAFDSEKTKKAIKDKF